jgi:hypothetical protein
MMTNQIFGVLALFFIECLIERLEILFNNKIILINNFRLKIYNLNVKIILIMELNSFYMNNFLLSKTIMKKIKSSTESLIFFIISFNLNLKKDLTLIKSLLN